MNTCSKTDNKLIFPKFPSHVKQVRNTVKTSSRQFEIMLNFFEKNMHVFRGKCDSEFTKEDMKRKWKILVHLLNTVADGPKKSEEKWKKTLKDWKLYVRGKAKRISEQKKQTGKYIPSKDKLTKLDFRLLTLLAKLNKGDLSDKIDDQDITENEIPLAIKGVPEDVENQTNENDVGHNNFKSSQSSHQKENILTDIAFKILEMQNEILVTQNQLILIEERKADAAMRKAIALERIAAAKERESAAVEAMYLIKKRKLEREEFSPVITHIKLDEEM